MKSNLEQHLKSSLEAYEAKYDPADWADMNSRLDKLNAAKSISKTGKVLMIAASLLAVSGLAYYFGTSSGEVAVPKNTLVQNNTPAAVTPSAASGTSPLDNSASATEETQHVTGTTSPGFTVVPPVQKQNAVTSPEKNESQPTTAAENKSNVAQDPAKTQPGTTTPVNEVLNASFRTDINKVCAGVAVQFAPDAASASCTYKWFFGDGEASAEQNPKHVFKQAGNYSVKLKVTSLKDKKSTEQRSNITVVAAPEVNFTVKSSEEDKLTVLFDADAEKGTDLKWDFGDKKTASGQNSEHAYAKYGSFKVTLTAKNSTGCTSAASQEVKVENKLYAPSAFSPNGDGRNDTWFPTFDDNGSFTLIIFDGSNSVVYTTTDINSPWEGMNPKTNAAVKEGEYFTWKAVVKDKKGMESTHTGKIFIVK